MDLTPLVREAVLEVCRELGQCVGSALFGTDQDLLPFMEDVAAERVQSHGFCFIAPFGTTWSRGRL